MSQERPDQENDFHQKNQHTQDRARDDRTRGGHAHDLDALAQWLAQGLKETLQYRFKKITDRDLWLQVIKSKVPTRSQIMHGVLKQRWLKSGYHFDFIKMGEATFYVIRKRLNPQGDRRLIFVPGFGDASSSWMAAFNFGKKDLPQYVDELITIDFPGHLGFLSQYPLTASLDVLLEAVKTVVKANPPTYLMGHSLGGWLAGKVAQDPELAQLTPKIKKLVLACPSGFIPPEEQVAFGEFIKSISKMPFQTMIKKLVYHPYPFYRALKKDFEWFYSKPELECFVDSAREDHFISTQKPFLANEVILIWGDHDQFVPTHWSRYWIEHFGPQLKVAMLKNIGHMIQIERPQATGRLLNTILTGQYESNSGWKWIHKTQRPNDYPYDDAQSSTVSGQNYLPGH